MRISAFLDELRAFEGLVPDTPCRLAPASFDPHDSSLTAFPRPVTARWQGCEDALKLFDASVVMLSLPFFWQVESYVRAGCEAARAGLFMNDPDNPTIGAEAVRAIGVDVVIQEASRFESFLELLDEKSFRAPRGFFLVHRFDSPSWRVTRKHPDIGIWREVHLFPGVPLLEQCVHACRAQSDEFHLSRGFEWSFSGDFAIISSRDESRVPLRNVEIPMRITRRDTCPCGHDLYTRSRA